MAAFISKSFFLIKNAPTTFIVNRLQILFNLKDGHQCLSYFAEIEM